MTPKEYMEQAYRIDQRIESKLAQIQSLNDLATKATSVMSLVPPSGTRNVHRMEDTIVKIVGLQEEINKDIDELVDYKHELVGVLRRVANPEYRTLLELRYLGFKTWEEIALEMGYSIQHIYRIRNRAVSSVKIKQKMRVNESKC
jgi:DNA-directed RNA polymerase specialized sigma subunit